MTSLSGFPYYVVILERFVSAARRCSDGLPCAGAQGVNYRSYDRITL